MQAGAVNRGMIRGTSTESLSGPPNSERPARKLGRVLRRARSRRQEAPDLVSRIDHPGAEDNVAWEELKRLLNGAARRLPRFVLTGAGLATTFGLLTAAYAQELFFEPREPLAPETQIQGDPAWERFFRPGAPWQHAASQTQVLSLITNYVIDSPDDELRKVGEWARAHNVALNIVIQPVAVAPSEICGRVEGYDNPEHIARAAAKLNQLGITPKYIALDGPLWSGHYAPGKCKFSIQETAWRTARNVRLLLDRFPKLVIDDIESDIIVLQPGWQADYREFKHTLEAVTRQPITLLTLDVKWPSPGWPENVKALHAMAKSLGMRFGVIYNGDGTDRSDTAWIAHAERNFTVIEAQLGIIPDRADFVSWNKYPTRALPESSPDTMTWLINQYRLPRTRFDARHDGSHWRVRLLDQANHPLAGKRVTIASLGVDPSRPPPVRSAAGTVPNEAAAAIIGLRINAECFCAGRNDLLLGDVTYAESGGAVTEKIRASELAKSARQDGISVAPASAGHIRFRVGRDQQLVYNSAKFAVTPGARYDFRVPVGSVTGDGLFGTATIIWLGADGEGLFRTNIIDDGDRIPVGTVTTDRNGYFAVSGSGSAQEVSFAGTAMLRPSLARIEATDR